MTPTWGELAKRIGWLCYGWYREQRRAWRHWKVSRRPVMSGVERRLRDRCTVGDLGIEPGAPIRIPSIAAISILMNQRVGVSNSYLGLQADALRNAAFDRAQNQYLLQNGARANAEDLAGAAAKILASLIGNGIAS